MVLTVVVPDDEGIAAISSDLMQTIHHRLEYHGYGPEEYQILAVTEHQDEFAEA